ncbi:MULTISPECIES: hypothetical protein [unclassified Mesorhizobium]|uniref:hypothetical protein n=1 Tax=unclassified Mesorhizobium TaxID=325217 RepID=UPI003339373D
MSVAQRVGPLLEQAITVLLNRADRRDTVSIKAALREAREAAPCLVASDEELTKAILEAATAMGLYVPFDGRE